MDVMYVAQWSFIQKAILSLRLNSCENGIPILISALIRLSLLTSCRAAWQVWSWTRLKRLTLPVASLEAFSLPNSAKSPKICRVFYPPRSCSESFWERWLPRQLETLSYHLKDVARSHRPFASPCTLQTKWLHQIWESAPSLHCNTQTTDSTLSGHAALQLLQQQITSRSRASCRRALTDVQSWLASPMEAGWAQHDTRYDCEPTPEHDPILTLCNSFSWSNDLVSLQKNCLCSSLGPAPLCTLAALLPACPAQRLSILITAC